jgi:hypothetical protein
LVCFENADEIVFKIPRNGVSIDRLRKDKTPTPKEEGQTSKLYMYTVYILYNIYIYTLYL